MFGALGLKSNVEFVPTVTVVFFFQVGRLWFIVFFHFDVEGLAWSLK